MEKNESSERKEQPKKWPNKVRQFLPLRFFKSLDLSIYKLFYLLLYGSHGSLSPYLPLYFKQLGLGANQAGLIVGIRPVVQCLGAPFWGTLADRYKAGRIILMGGIMAWILKAFLILAVRPNNQQCIHVYVNKSGNESQTLIFVENLWKLRGGEEKWVTVPLVQKPVIIPKNKLVNVGHGHHIKQVNLKPTKGGRKTKEGNGSAEHTGHQHMTSLLSKSVEMADAVVDTDSALDGHLQDTGANIDQAIKEKPNEQKMVKHSNKSSVVSYSSSKKQAAKAKQTLTAIGKIITSSVRTFDKSINATVIDVTQLDIRELYHLFVIFTLFIIIGEFLESPTYTLSDSSLLKRLGEQVERYGQVRMFGSMGAGVAVVVVGAIVYTSRFELCSTIQQNYMAAFYMYIALACGAFITVAGFQFEYSDEDIVEPAFKKAAKLLLRPKRLSFMVTAWFAGVCYGFLFHYVNWFIDDINGDSVIMGVAGGVREFAGIIIFFLGGRLSKLMGHANCLACGLIAYVTISFVYSFLTVPWFAVALEAVSGAAYAIIWSTCVGYVNTIGRTIKNRSSLQGILQGVFWGLGNGGGTVISGLVYDKFGPQITFRAFGVAGLIVLVFFVIVQRFYYGEQDNEEPETGYDAVASEEEEEEEEKNEEKEKNEEEEKESDEIQVEKNIDEKGN